MSKYNVLNLLMVALEVILLEVTLVVIPLRVLRIRIHRIRCAYAWHHDPTPVTFGCFRSTNDRDKNEYE